MKKRFLLYFLVALMLALICVLASCGHQHKFGDWYPAASPTCAQLGVEKRECSCGKYETREIGLLEHSYDELEIVEEATCINNGKNKKKCLNCGFVCEEETSKTTTHRYTTVGCRDCGKWKYDIKKDKLPVVVKDLHGHSCEIITANVIFQELYGNRITINCTAIYKEKSYSSIIKCVLVRSDGTVIDTVAGLWGPNEAHPGVPYTIIDEILLKENLKEGETYTLKFIDYEK